MISYITIMAHDLINLHSQGCPRSDRCSATTQSALIVSCRVDKRFHDCSSRMFLAPSLLCLPSCLQPALQSSQSKNPSSWTPCFSDSDPNLSGIPSSWSACWAVLNHSAAWCSSDPHPGLLDCLHPRWCNPVLDCRFPTLFLTFFCPGKVRCERMLFPSNVRSFLQLEYTQVSYSFKK